MQHEDAWMQSQTKGSRRVKLDRGQNWIVRFLPARMGPDGLWFARIAKHWVNKLPIVCPHNTAEDFGGDPEFVCPVCQLADELNDSADEVISKFGFKAKANAQFLTYCVVWEKNGVQQPMSEVLVPYEFNHYKSTWEELKGFYMAGGRKSGDSVLDYKTGNDFSVNKGGKGMRLDKLDASPIFDLDDPKWNEHIKKLEAAMKTPKVVIPTAEQINVFVRKMQEAADRGGYPADDGDDRPRRGRGGDSEESQFRRGSRREADEPEDDLPYDDAPPRRSAERAPAPASSRRSAPEPEDAEQEPRRRSAPVDSDEPRRRAPEPEDDPQPRRRAAEPEAEAPRRRAPEPEPEEPPRRREPEPEAPRRRAAEPQDDVPRRRAAAEDDPQPRRRAVDQDPEPSVPRDDPEPKRPTDDPEPEDPERADRRSVAATPRRGLAPTERQSEARREASSSTPQREAEDDDPLPEDDKDPVPPAAKVDADDAPPAVERRGSTGSDVKSRLEKLGRKA
jgi:hypothetical protein